MIEPKLDFFGRSQAQWLSAADNETRRDAIALAEIIHQAKHGFGLVGVPLKDYVRRVILFLLESGAQPVVSSDKENVFWERAIEFDGEFSVVIPQIIERWEQSGTDDAYFVWFSHNSS
jgi:hypothetical protein